VALIVEDFQVHIGKLMPAFKRRLERNQDHPDQLHPLLVALVAAADEFDVIAKGFFCSVSGGMSEGPATSHAIPDANGQ
jgi:hypothetical protein